MNEAFSTTLALKAFPVPLLPEGKDIRGPVAFFPPLFWSCLFCRALSFAATTVYMLAVLSHNLQQYLRSVGDLISTLKVIRKAHENPRQCSTGVISPSLVLGGTM